MVFPGRQVEKRMFPYRKPTAYIYNFAMRYRADL